MTQSARASVPWIFWPFTALWGLLTFVLKLTGRLVGIILALVLILVSAVLAITIVGIPIAIPFFLLGMLLLIRSLF